jgi:hypothetical protein
MPGKLFMRQKLIVNRMKDRQISVILVQYSKEKQTVVLEKYILKLYTEGKTIISKIHLTAFIPIRVVDDFSNIKLKKDVLVKTEPV